MHCIYCHGNGYLDYDSSARYPAPKACLHCEKTGLNDRHAGEYLSFISRVDTALGEDCDLLGDYRRSEKIEWYLSNHTPAEIARLVESAADGDPRHYPPASIL